MNDDVSSRKLIDQLAARMLDDGLSGDEHARLLEGIQTDFAACDRFVDHMMLHAVLRKELGAHRPATLSESLFGALKATSAPAICELPPSGRTASRDWRHPTEKALLFLAMGISFAFLGAWYVRLDGSANRVVSQAVVQNPARTDVMPVAYLAVANGCDWGRGGSKAWSVGRTFDSGEELTLYEGTAVFRLSNGVTLNLEGPAALVMTSPTSLVLRSGKLTALAPWSVTEFCLLAANCRISARDAEFGVDVNGSNVDVHVFSGEVTATSSPFFDQTSLGSVEEERLQPDGPMVQPVTLRDGESVLFSADEDVVDPLVRGVADRNRFVTKLSMSGRLAVTSQYVASVMKSKPLGYWRFESIRDEQILNEVKGGLPPLRALGEVVLAGDRTNHAVEFGSHANSALVSAERLPAVDWSDYSVELWAKPSHFHFGMLVTMTMGPDSPADHGKWFNEKHGFMLEAQPGYQCEYGNPGSIRYLHRNPPGFLREAGTSCYSNSLYGLRRWQHIVAVKERSAMRLYIDGQSVGEESDSTPLARSLYLVVGQHLSDNSGLNRFVGQLDELAIYDRALSEQEIAEHWKSVDETERSLPGI
jgi:hypothetical protein